MIRYSLLGVLFLLPLPAAAQQKPAQQILVVFKDGFHFKALVRQDKTFIVDPVSKKPIEIANYKGFLFFEDPIRRIYFSPAHVAKPVVLKDGELSIPNMIRIDRDHSFGTRTMQILPGYYFDGPPSDWNQNWERTFSMVIRTPSGPSKKSLTQRMVYLDPLNARAEAKDYAWDACFSTKELNPEMLRHLLVSHLNSKKDFKDWKDFQKRFYIATFFVQCGNLDAAEKEIETILTKAPDQQKALKAFQEQLKQTRADQAAEEIERAHRVGQQRIAHSRVELFFKEGWDLLVAQKQKASLQDLRLLCDEQAEKLKEARKAIKELPPYLSPGQRDAWEAALKTIDDDLDHANLDRLETFLSFVKGHLQQLAAGKTPEQPTEKIAALAVSGWLLGNGSAEADPELALKLWQTRKTVLAIASASDAVERAKKIEAFQKDPPIAIDLLARLIKLLPPIKPLENFGTQPRKMDIELSDSRGGSYHLILPPDYHPQRTYPVLMVLHGTESPDAYLPRFTELASKHGYILAAPHWSQGMGAKYTYSEQEHSLVLDTLRDFRRRCLIDSDRVFLHGFEQGATMAWDVGLSHPDQFAGVIPMCGSPKGFATTYATNGQNLPFYVIDGDQNGSQPKTVKEDIVKTWVRGHYPSLYIEYKGRGLDWFSGEITPFFDWMDRKKRVFPQKTLGRAEHEYKTTRSSDNRFYWLSTDQVLPKHLSDGNIFPSPARLSATVGVGNQADVKTGAKIWTQFNINTSGLKQVSLLVSPQMVDFTKPVSVYVNGARVHSPAVVTPKHSVLLEDFCTQGDRQSLYYARLDFKW